MKIPQWFQDQEEQARQRAAWGPDPETAIAIDRLETEAPLPPPTVEEDKKAEPANQPAAGAPDPEVAQAIDRLAVEAPALVTNGAA